MLIGRIGTHEIYRTVGDKIAWRCTCERGEPGTDGYPCRALVRFWASMRAKSRPPAEMKFTQAGADACIAECKCLRRRGAALVREQIAAKPPNVPAPTGRNRPCPCGSGGKYKQCCGAAAEGAQRKYFAPGTEATAPAEPIEVVPEATHKRRKRIAELEERRATIVRRVDDILSAEHKRDDADRAVRRARELERAARTTFRGQGSGAAQLRAEAGELRANAAQLRAEAKEARARIASARPAKTAQPSRKKAKSPQAIHRTKRVL